VNDDTAEVILTLSLTPELAEPIADWLLTHEPDLGFTSMAAHGHGIHPERMNLLEQVIGKQRRVELQIVMPAARAATLIERMTSAFSHTDAYYWLTPVLRSGRFQA
jgi:hypothetical protein